MTLKLVYESLGCKRSSSCSFDISLLLQSCFSKPDSCCFLYTRISRFPPVIVDTVLLLYDCVLRKLLETFNGLIHKHQWFSSRCQCKLMRVSHLALLVLPPPHSSQYVLCSFTVVSGSRIPIYSHLPAVMSLTEKRVFILTALQNSHVCGTVLVVFVYLSAAFNVNVSLLDGSP